MARFCMKNYGKILHSNSCGLKGMEKIPAEQLAGFAA